MKHLQSIIPAVALVLLAGCSDKEDVKYPEHEKLPDLPEIADFQKGNRAPLYWSVYEACWEQDKAGIANARKDFTPEQWDEVIDMMATTFLPHGYDMICTDGFIPMYQRDGSLFQTHYGSQEIKALVAKAKARGLKVGIYDNPVWAWCDWTLPVPGTDKTVGDLTPNLSDKVINQGIKGGYPWVVASKPGAKEYIDAFFKYYHDLGVEYIRADFLCWYEDGFQRPYGAVDKGFGRETYARMMAYSAEAAKKYGIYFSLVMPNLYNDAEIEQKYGHLTRIVKDTDDGGWMHASAQDRGIAYKSWPNCNNVFDGFVYWSHITGRDKIRLDGDFIRLNKFSTDAEKEFIVSINLMAGGPVTISDLPATIRGNEKFYINDEMLALNKDGFVGHPLSDKMGDADNQIWSGQMSNGDWVVGLFNRDDSPRDFNIRLDKLGIKGTWKGRDLWQHADLGDLSAIKATVAAHGCKIVRLSK